MTAKRPRERALWLRPALFAAFALSLPLTWRESAPASCDGTPIGAMTHERGWHLLSDGVELSLVVAFLVVAALALGLLVANARPITRLVGHLVAAVASVMLFLVSWVAATFSLFAPVRLREGAYLGLLSLALAGAEALTRAGLAFAHWLRQRQGGSVGPDPEPP